MLKFHPLACSWSFPEAFLLSLFLTLVSTPVFSQIEKPAETKDEYESIYQQRIEQENINGVYIPRDLADAFAQLNRLIDAESKRKFLAVDEAEAARKLHFSLGRWITRNWGFYEGSRLSHYIRRIGVYHPDDMARFVIVSYHRYLNKKDLDIKEQLEFYQEKQAAQRKEYIEQGTILYQEKRQLSEEDLPPKKSGGGGPGR